MKNTLFCCNSAEYSSCDPVNLASPWRRIKEVSLMAMRTTASSKGICILRFSMLSIHVVVYRLYPTCVHLTSSNTAGKNCVNDYFCRHATIVILGYMNENFVLYLLTQFVAEL